MNYTVFHAHSIGQAHVQMGMGCEDYSVHYSDPEGRFVAAAVCDGHSDPRCFRSARGAELGCRTAAELLRNLMEGYCADTDADRLTGFLERKEDTFQRFRAAFVSRWNEEVRRDLAANPVTEAEWKKLDTPSYREAYKLYRSGSHLNNIYGATMLATAACDDFYIVMHIGDGVTICLKEGGWYSVALEDDDRDETLMGPESMCDSDLTTRPKAFRMQVFTEPVQAVFVTSDGIGDSPLALQVREHLCQLHRELVKRGEEAVQRELNPEQQKFLESFVQFYTARGVKDDCSIAGFYDSSIPVSEVHLTQAEIDALNADLQKRRQQVQAQYAERISRLQEKQNSLEAEKKKLDAELGERENEMHSLQARMNSIHSQLEKLWENLKKKPE